MIRDRVRAPAVAERSRWRSLALVVTLITATWQATRILATVLGADGDLGGVEVLILVAFALTFAWISANFALALIGLWATMRRANSAASGLEPPAGLLPRQLRVALLVPIRHEDCAQVLRHIRATERSLATTGQRDRFEWFILSDSERPEVIRAEQAMWAALNAEPGLADRVFYRTRTERRGRKAGNLAEFLRHWGARYRYFVVFDADSVMAGDTLTRLVGLMEANPDAGLIQTLPRPVGGQGLFARSLQFAAQVQGRLMAAGLAHCCPGRATYFGHNAIVRTAAFMAHAALPDLPGRPPLGGEILSHDFVEAALLRRAGWSVWLLPELSGSWEGLPATLGDLVQRDRRWCQGNLQHLRLLRVKGLTATSRVQLAAGAAAYLASPLWLTLLFATTLNAATAPLGLGPDLFTVHPETAVLPASDGRLIVLLGWTVSMVIGPRLMALGAALADPLRRRGFGGGMALLRSSLVELIGSLLLAPVQAVYHAAFVLGTLLGRSVVWGAQARHQRAEGWRDALANHGAVAALGTLWAAAVLWLVPGLAWWLAPVLVGLMLAVPVAVMTSHQGLGEWARRRGWLLIPEEFHPPQELIEQVSPPTASPAPGWRDPAPGEAALVRPAA